MFFSMSHSYTRDSTQDSIYDVYISSNHPRWISLATLVYAIGVNRALIIAAILLLLGGGYTLYKKTLPRSEVVAESKQDVQVTTETEKEDSEAYTIDVQYPQFGIPSIDADVKSKIDAALAEFRSLPPNPPESATPKNEFTGIYEDVYVGEDVISFRLILSQYTGGAHPMTIFSGLTYDRVTGRQLLQQDAFAMLGMSVEDVSSSATAQLQETLGDSFFEEGANTNPENFSSFIVSTNTVTFIFQPYQVAPYAAGPQEVSFERER